MKYMKIYEQFDYITSDKLISGQMYMCHTVTEDTPICFVGNIGIMLPLLFIVFNEDRIIHLKWLSSLKFDPLNITIKEYIIKNNIVNKTLEFIGISTWLSTRAEMKLFVELESKLLNDEDIMRHKDLELNAEKYNL